MVVIPHLFPAECLTSLRRHGRLTVPFVNIATDYACIPFWEETAPDYFVIPHEKLADDFTSRGIDEKILLPAENREEPGARADGSAIRPHDIAADVGKHGIRESRRILPFSVKTAIPAAAMFLPA